MVKQAGVNLKTYAKNQVLTVNHAGRHVNEYSQTVKGLLDKAFIRVKGQGPEAAQEALDDVMKTIKNGINDGSIQLYKTKDVYIP